VLDTISNSFVSTLSRLLCITYIIVVEGEKKEILTTTTTTAMTAGSRAAFARAAVVFSPRGLRRNRRRSFFSAAASGNTTNASAGECELVECEANFGDDGDDESAAIKACVARINGKEINASAMRNLTLLNSSGEMQKLPLTGDKDVVVYLRHLG